MTSTVPDRFERPTQLNCGDLHWVPAMAPGTVAQALQAAGEWSIDEHQDFDTHDWWYRCTFTHASTDADGAGVRRLLRFHGLATLADVWLNDQPILHADNMFREYAVDVTTLLAETNELAIRFRALTNELARRRPRPRWKTRLVAHQQLRWIRTTLLGRIPGWSPPVAPVGPWREVSLERETDGTLSDIDIQSSVDGGAGILNFSCNLSFQGEAEIAAQLIVGDASIDLRASRQIGGYHIAGELRLEDVVRWWPHTHGSPHLYPCAIRIVVNGHTLMRRCGPVGFRQIELRQHEGGFELHVNGTPVFCRGACWTINDIVSLTGAPSELSRVLQLMRQAGANMLRIGGTMIYEDDEVYRLCDELGIMVWQDFMFANMDYPFEDDNFLSSVTAEVTQQLRRLSRHPSVSIYCGNSEVEQQAAMLGVARDAWRSPLFSRVIPDLCRRWHAHTPYVPSTPSGGSMPFHVSTGVTHYYGVGAYKRPIAEVRRANVRFAAECLGFANLPEQPVVDLVMADDVADTPVSRWKRRAPRDAGAECDFEDVRDHYLRELFAVDPDRLRAFDAARYLELGRATSGEVMSRVFSEWRSAYSQCHGGLIWFLKDFWPGAGSGILDSFGTPKAVFYYLRRAWQPQAVVLTDEGLDGIHVHVINETDRPLVATVELTLLRDGQFIAAQASTVCRLAPRARATYGSDELLLAFHDVSYAYRFGPPAHDVVAAALHGPSGDLIGEAFWFPRPVEPARHAARAIKAEGRPIGDNSYEVALSSPRFVHAAHFSANGFLPEDNYFHLMPGRTKRVRFHPCADAPPDFIASVASLSWDDTVPVDVQA